MVRYAVAVDTRDWGMLRSCFTDDAVTDYEDVGAWTTAADMVSFMEAAHVGFGRSNHLLSNLSVSVDGDRATAHSYVHAVLMFLDTRAGWVEVVGSYDDVLVCTPDGWRIAIRTFGVTRMLAGANPA